jgi:hypothetical protein
MRDERMTGPMRQPVGFAGGGALPRFGMVLLAVALLFAGTVPAAAAGAGSSDAAEVGLEVYLWGASIGGTTAAGDPMDVPFKDLVKNLDLGFMSTFGVRKGRWVGLGDVIYLDLGDDIRTTANIVGNPIEAGLDLKLKGWVLNFGGGYRAVQTETFFLDVLVGARYLDLDTKLDFNIGGLVVPFSESGHVWDGIVAVRGTADLAEKWYLSYYLDVGTGGSDVTWQALGAVSYRFKKLDVRLGYRYLKWNFDEDDPGGNTFGDLNFHGPYAGLVFTF